MPRFWTLIVHILILLVALLIASANWLPASNKTSSDSCYTQTEGRWNVEVQPGYIAVVKATVSGFWVVLPGYVWRFFVPMEDQYTFHQNGEIYVSSGERIEICDLKIEAE